MIIRDDLTEHNDDEEINEVEVHTLIFITLKDKKKSKQAETEVVSSSSLVKISVK